MHKITGYKFASYILYGIVLFTLGFYANIIATNYLPFNFSKTINLTVNPSSIFSILITVALAYYVTRVLSQQNEQEKQEKYILIDYFKDFQKQCITTIYKILDCNEFNSALTISEFKFLRQKLHSSIELAKLQKFVNENISSKLHSKLTDIWELLTDESHYDTLGLKQEHKSLVRTQMIIIDELIFKIIVEINRKN